MKPEGIEQAAKYISYEASKLARLSPSGEKMKRFTGVVADTIRRHCPGAPELPDAETLARKLSDMSGNGPWGSLSGIVRGSWLKAANESLSALAALAHPPTEGK